MSAATRCPDCGWTTRPAATPARAAYALRRHSCDLHRVRQERAQRAATRRADTGIRRDCQHPGARHTHGSRAAYVADRCRCRACRDDVATYMRDKSRQVKDGRWQPYVDADPVRAHVATLRAAGIGWRRIARIAGLNESVVWKLVHGDPARGLAARQRVRPATAAALLAVTVDGRGTRGGVVPGA